MKKSNTFYLKGIELWFSGLDQFVKSISQYCLNFSWCLQMINSAWIVVIAKGSLDWNMVHIKTIHKMPDKIRKTSIFLIVVCNIKYIQHYYWKDIYITHHTFWVHATITLRIVGVSKNRNYCLQVTNCPRKLQIHNFLQLKRFNYIILKWNWVDTVMKYLRWDLITLDQNSLGSRFLECLEVDVVERM